MLSTETSQRDGVSRNLNSSITNSRSEDSQEEDVIQRVAAQLVESEHLVICTRRSAKIKSVECWTSGPDDGADSSSCVKIQSLFVTFSILF